MLYRPLAKHKAWWDGKAAKRYEFSDYVFGMLWNHFFPRLMAIPANDEDHLRW